MGLSYEKIYEVHYYECDKNLNCTIESIMNFLGDIGNKHAESLNVGIDYLNSKNLTWVFYKYDIQVNRYPKYGEKIRIKTIAKQFKKFYALRGYELYDEDNEMIIEGNAIFLLIDTVKRRAVRITDEQYEAYDVDKNTLGKDLIGRLERLEKVSEEQYINNFKVRYSDIDSNNHVNNVKYVQWVMDTIPAEIVNNHQLKEIKIMFEKECYLNDEIRCVCEVQEGEEEISILSRVEDADSKELTAFMLKWK